MVVRIPRQCNVGTNGVVWRPVPAGRAAQRHTAASSLSGAALVRRWSPSCARARATPYPTGAACYLLFKGFYGSVPEEMTLVWFRYLG